MKAKMSLESIIFVCVKFASILITNTHVILKYDQSRHTGCICKKKERENAKLYS